MSAQSADKLKQPQMAFELFELVSLLRVRPRVSQQHSKGKRGSLFGSEANFSIDVVLSFIAVQCRLGDENTEIHHVINLVNQ